MQLYRNNKANVHAMDNHKGNNSPNKLITEVEGNRI